LNRRLFCAGQLAAPTLASKALSQTPAPKAWDHYRRIRFVPTDPLDHPFFWCPRTLLSYPIVFEQRIDQNRLVLTRTDTAEPLPIQFSYIVKDSTGISSATLSFLSDLPSGARREFVAQKPTSLTIHTASLSDKHAFYIDGAASEAHRDATSLTIELPEGQHHWEFTDTLPVPIAPTILRTENRSGGARIFVTPVAAATQYRLELSTDNGARWTPHSTQSTPTIDVAGLPNGHKIHLRAIAENVAHESLPGDEYPLYITNQIPPPPDCLRVTFSTAAPRSPGANSSASLSTASTPALPANEPSACSTTASIATSFTSTPVSSAPSKSPANLPARFTLTSSSSTSPLSTVTAKALAPTSSTPTPRRGSIGIPDRASPSAGSLTSAPINHHPQTSGHATIRANTILLQSKRKRNEA
jgi:hypothetical protein